MVCSIIILVCILQLTENKFNLLPGTEFCFTQPVFPLWSLLSTAVIHPCGIQEVPSSNPSRDATVLTLSKTFRILPKIKQWPPIFSQFITTQSYVICGYETPPINIALRNSQIMNRTFSRSDSADVNDSEHRNIPFEKILFLNISANRCSLSSALLQSVRVENWKADG
jgi:hypothetical protein